MLLTDTNVLVRCCRGRAMERVWRLVQEDVPLATTTHNAVELRHVLADQFGLADDALSNSANAVLDVFHIVPGELYFDMRGDAERRLTGGGKSDWPLLAAAMALNAQIWSDDRDFFGVGVAVWTSMNVGFLDIDRNMMGRA